MSLIRRAGKDDIPAITAIYNEAIRTTTATFDTEEKTLVEQEAWFRDHGRKNPVMVAEHEGRIVAWASLSKWSDRCAYKDTAEVSLYVAEDQRGKGIGTELLRRVLAEGERSGLHSVIARITQDNDVSLRLHASLGFVPIGVMHEVGEKFGRRLDVHLMEKIFESK
jgi:L-amino acid N-acyltransferase